MKVIRDNECYVQPEDLLRFPVPDFIKLPNRLKIKEFVRFEEQNEIEYFKNRQDIVDYDSVSKLSEIELKKMIQETKEKFLKMSSVWLESSLRVRTKLNQDEEYQNNLKILKAIYECLSHYSYNRKHIDFAMKFIKLIYSCQDYPRVCLSENGHALPNTFDPEDIVNTCVENGFIETYCLSNEEREEVKRIRELKKSTIHD